MTDVRATIQTGDAAALRGLLEASPGLANQAIKWGKDRQIATHPLHYISDMLFDGTLEPVDGALHPDRTRAGNGLTVKEDQLERYRSA